MSRCGSTLASQMLSALPGSVVISEAGPIDSVLRAQFRDPSVSAATRIEWLRWVVSALGQRRSGNETHLFIKFDSWSALELPLIRQAFPGVPWVFLYSNPVEVLVSQLRKRGAHMVPGTMEPALFGMNLAEAFEMQPEQYCARVLALTCEAALQHHQSCAGLMINYEQLPDALWTSLAGSLASKFRSRTCKHFNEWQRSMPRIRRLRSRTTRRQSKTRRARLCDKRRRDGSSRFMSGSKQYGCKAPRANPIGIASYSPFSN